MATTQLDTYVLTSLDNVKSFMSFDDDKGDVPDDNLINGLINRVSAVMETYADRKFMSREDTEYYDGGYKRRLYTNREPITSVSGIWDDGSWAWGSSTLVAATNYRVSNDGRSIILKDGLSFSNYTESVKITYTAGYATIPYDLEDACIKQIASVFKSKEDIHVFSKSLEDGSVERYQTALLPSVKLILDRYRNKDIV